MDHKHLSGYSRSQLLKMAKSAGVRRRHRMSRARLIEVLAGTVLAAEGQGAPDLPAAYGKTVLTLLEVEPHLAHAFWEVTDEERRLQETAPGPAGTPVWVLRFYSNGNGAQKFFDEEVSLSSGNWYVRLRSPHRIWFAELGLKTPAGVFKPICRSNQLGPPQVPALCGAGWLRVDASGTTRPASAPIEHLVLYQAAHHAEPGQSSMRESFPGSAVLGTTAFRKA